MSGSRDEAFLNACAMTGTLRLVAEGGGGLSTEVWAGSRPFALIGRDANADLHLDHETISRRHIYLQAVDGRLLGIDLGSRAGIRRGGKPWRSGWLDSGDVLGVGSYEVRIEESGASRAEGFAMTEDSRGPLSSRYRARDGLPGVSLEISVPGRSAVLWRMGRVMVLIGSSPDCKLRLVDQNVARFQCSLLRTPAGPWVVDLLGDGGIFLNGEFVRDARLEHGDRLQVGHALIRVRLDNPSPGERGRPLRALGSSPTPRALMAMMPTILPASKTGPHLPLSMFPEGWAASDDPGVQFGALQQQMFDQFHQLMMGMIQAFGAMHHEQMGAVRDDLDQLEQITRELQDLRSTPTASPQGVTRRGRTGPGTVFPSRVAKPRDIASRRSPDCGSEGRRTLPHRSAWRARDSKWPEWHGSSSDFRRLARSGPCRNPAEDPGTPAPAPGALAADRRLSLRGALSRGLLPPRGE